MKNDKIILKIQKLMALANNNSNDHEAMDAMLKAQQLMAKHQISISNIMTDKEKREVKTENVLSKKARATRNIKLSMIISSNFRCKPALNGDSLQFIGLSTDVMLATEMFKQLYKFIEKRRRQIYKEYQTAGLNTKGVRDTYVMGFLDGLEEQFREQVKSNCYDMVVVEPQEVKDHMDKHYTTKKSSRTASTNYDPELRGRGYNDGKGYGKEIGGN